LSSICVENTRVWTANASQTGAYVAEFIANGSVVASTALNLTANTPQTFTFAGDPTTLSAVRLVFNGTPVAAESGPFESCAPPPPTATLSSICVENTRVWTANASQTGAYVAEFIANGSVVASTALNLTANTPQTFTFAGDPTTLSAVRLVFNGTTLATDEGPFEGCAEPPTITLTPVCSDEGLVWRVTTNLPGNYQAQVVSNGTVIETIDLTLTANEQRTFQFNADSATPNIVRIVFQNREVIAQEGPEPCVSGLSASLAPVCARSGIVWTVFTNRSGNYVAQLMDGVTIVESVNLTLTEFVDTEVTFQNDSSSPRLVRLIFQGSTYAEQPGLTTPCTPTSLPPDVEPVMTNFLYLPTVNR
jgi:hypothetical protein